MTKKIPAQLWKHELKSKKVEGWQHQMSNTKRLPNIGAEPTIYNSSAQALGSNEDKTSVITAYENGYFTLRNLYTQGNG